MRGECDICCELREYLMNGAIKIVIDLNKHLNDPIFNLGFFGENLFLA